MAGLTGETSYSQLGKSSKSESVNLRTFNGGLNNVSDITTIDNEELTQLTNFELDSNGSLVSRPPIVKISEPPVTTEAVTLLGYYTDASQDIFAVVSTPAGTYLFDTDTETYTLITTIVASGSAQFNNNLYIFQCF